MRMVICLAAAVMASMAAWGDTQVVLYNQGFGLVQEPRQVELEGQGILEIADLPQSLLYDSLFVEGLEVHGMRPRLAQSVPADVEAGTAAYLDAMVGHEVEAYARGEVLRGRLLAADEGVVLSTEAGRVVLPSFDKIVDLSVRGTMVELDYVAQPGPREIVLSYLAQRMHWSVAYTAVLEAKTLSLVGRARLENLSGRDYEGVKVSLVAGDVDAPKTSEVAFRQVPGMGLAEDEWPQVETAFDYHRYTLPAPVDLARGTLFVPLVRSEASYERVYRFSEGPVRVVVTFEAPDEPLPAGEIRVFDEAGELYVGSSRIGHTPAGASVELAVGTAFDLTGERVQVKRERPAEDLHRDTYRVTLRSSKDEDVQVEVIQSLRGTWAITEASHPYDVLDAGRIRFLLDVPGNDSAEVTYTVEWRY